MSFPIIPTGILKSKVNTDFTFTINTALGTGDSFQLPLPSGETYNFVVNWGDGNSDTIIVYNQTETLHSYSSGGTYQISISGKCGGWSFNNGGDRLKITSVDQWGDVGFDYLVGGFYGCSNLSSISNDALNYSGTDLSNLFRLCTSLSAISANLFSSLNSVTNCSALLFGCSGITSLPSAIFDGFTSATLFTNLLNGCTGLTSLPNDVFRYNTEVVSMSGVLISCSGLTSLPNDIFRYNTKVTTFSDALRGLTGLAGGSLPNNLFYYNKLVTNYGTTLFLLRQCTLPAVLFDLSVLNIVTTFNDFMRTSSSNFGTIQDIWNYTSASSTTALTNNTALTNYASIPASWL